MYLCQRSETTELLIVLSEAERQSLRAGLIEDGEEIITQMLVDIDVEEAKAEQESDHRQLSVRFARLSVIVRWLSRKRSLLVQTQFREMEGGYHRANVELKAYLRDGWVLPALPVLVEESAAALAEGASDAAQWEHARLCYSVGAVMRQNGQLEPALAH